MSYCNQADIEAVFGVENVAVWSNLSNDSLTADSSRISEAIAFACVFIDARFRLSVYELPLRSSSGLTPLQIRDMAARLAGTWLFESRGMGDDESLVADVRASVEKQIDRILAGQISLDAQRHAGHESGPRVIHD